MKTVTREYKVYEFKELSDDVKASVIDSHYENEDYPFLTENIEMEIDNIDSYFSKVKLYYSLSSCQGDGLCIEGDFNINKWLEDNHPKIKASVHDTICNYVTFTSKGNTNHYCYASKSDIEMDCGSCYSYPRLDKLLDSILKDIQDYYMDICKQLEKYGYSILEYRMDNDEMQEYCETNECVFLKNGEVFSN